MSLEEALNANTAAVKALTAAMKGGTGSATSTAANTTAAKGTAANKPPATKGKTVTPEAACALIQKLNDEHGKTVARGVLNDCGLAKMADIDASNAKEVLAAAKEKLEELAEGGEEEDGGDDI